MRNLLIIGGMCVLAIAIGAWLYFYGMPGAAPESSPQAANATTAPASMSAVHFTVLADGIHATGENVRKNYAIYDAKEFGVFWKEGEGNAVPPTIDFNKNYVIAVFAGTEPTGGYSIAVTGVTDTAGARTVAITLTKPGKGCTVLQSTTSPFQYISVPIMDAPTLAHTDSVVTTDCN